MRSVSATEAKQKFAELLDTAQREPVVIRRHDRDIAVVISAREYEQIRAANVAEFQHFCDDVAQKATERGMTPEILEEILSDGKSAASGY